MTWRFGPRKWASLQALSWSAGYRPRYRRPIRCAAIQIGQIKRHRRFSHAKEPVDIDDNRDHLTVLRPDRMAHFTDLLVIGSMDGRTHQLFPVR